ncbi:MAG: hypothetical protein IAF38_20845 [Bacteroidia bacterium]|nr:hypothetical protein [Bacteroidia bacterium]
MKKNTALLLLLLVFSALNVAKAQSHDNKGCSLNKNFNPTKETYTCKVCIMEIEKARAEKKAREASSSKAERDNDIKAKKAAMEKAMSEKAALEAERKKKADTEKNKLQTDSTGKIKPAEKPQIN